MGVSVAALTGAVANMGFEWARGSDLVASYLALCVGLALGLGALVAGAAALLGAPVRWTLVAYVAATALLVRGPFSAAVCAIAAGAVLELWARRGAVRDLRAAVSRGGEVGFAIASTFILWPRVLIGKDLLADPARAEELGGAIVLGLVLLAFWVAAWLRRRWRLFPPGLVLIGAGVLVLFVALPSRMGARRVDLPPSRGMEGLRADGASRPHLLLLILDTVRADHLSVYGYPRDTTPFLERLAAGNQDVVVFPGALSPSPWTAPSHASLFSGLPVARHGVHWRKGGDVSSFYFGELPDSPTLAESVRAAGYRTAGIYANVNVLRIGGGDRGLEVVYSPPISRPLQLIGEGLRSRLFPDLADDSIAPHPEAAAVNEGVLRFLDQCLPGPCFVMANYMDAHIPLHPRPPHAGRYRDTEPPPGAVWSEETRKLAAAYDEAIRGLDERLAELFAALEDRGVLDDAWVIITSDHGEAFEEHGRISHGTSVYHEQTRIPLIVKPPRGQRLPRREDPVGLLDVAATVSSIAGGAPVGLGRDLRDPGVPEVPEFIDLFSPEVGELRAVVYQGRKLIQAEGEPRELYDLARDPGEHDNRIASEPERSARLERLLPERVTGTSTGTEERKLSVGEERTLRALGYVE